MHFLADESCDFTIVRSLRKAGYHVKAIQEICPGADDEQVADLAAKEKRILLTEDKDFGQMVFATSHVSVGVIFFRFPGNVRKRIGTLTVEIVQRMGEKLEKHFTVVQPGKIRISEIPK